MNGNQPPIAVFATENNSHHKFMHTCRAGPEDSYPKSGIIRCEILEQWRDPSGRDLVRVTTEQPDYVETKEGVTEFVVLSSQVISAAATIAEMARKATACEGRAKSEPNRADALLREAATYSDWIAALAQGHWPTRKAL